MNKYFVTGGYGLVGSAVCRQLETAGASFVAPRRAELNLLDRDAVERFIADERPTHLIHLASQVFGLQGNLRNQLSSLSLNTRINENLLAGLAGSSVKKVFFAGTVASYPFPYISLPLREEDMFKGLPHFGEYGYANSKIHAFHYLELLKKYNDIDYVYGVFTNMYGPNDRFDVENGHVVPSLIRKAEQAVANGTPLEVWGRPDTTRDFMYVDDAARAAIHLLDRASGVVNIASGIESSMGDLADAVCTAAGISAPIKWLSDKPVGIPRRSVDVTRLADTGFTANTSLKDGVGRTYSWFKENLASARLT
ncbi:NAD-dependent epimerase/dehydratase family protein [Burkholderia sp. BCC0044]|uniref:NAD-dependent epimerase/dehydratase family protein n=1 Tax=Burkholderia sp. BCC0044 TaxID=2676295 RepID=UPI00158CD0BA|nr:NAD-dependent epimerase/dehydratase family protein [Burkholderia sp. BCC0044]